MQPAQRVSNLRGDIKKKTNALVHGYYGCNTFNNKDELQEAIQWLKEEGMYHYPCNPKVRTSFISPSEAWCNGTMNVGSHF